MLFCNIRDIQPGMVVGASVPHPSRLKTELVRPGVPIDARMIEQLNRFGVTTLWIHHEATNDLDFAAAPGLTEARVEVFKSLSENFERMAESTITSAQVNVHRAAVSALMLELASNTKYAHLSHQMLQDPTGIFEHCANVAYLSLLVGIELMAYVVSQRPRMAANQATDVVPLGLGAMLHDIGKINLSKNVQQHHEIFGTHDDPEVAREYSKHISVGYDQLKDCHMPATARHAVKHHHQRFDGSGWPLAPKLRGVDVQRAKVGEEIHIFSRIIAAANVLDNLMISATGERRPAVAGLSAFAGQRFDGWFDPVVRDLMIRRIPPFPIGSMVRLSDARVAVVVTPNFKQPCRPNVRLIDDTEESGQLVDLYERRDVWIVECAGDRVDQYLFDLDEVKTAHLIAAA